MKIIVYSIYCVILIIISVIDLKKCIIPNFLTLFLLFLGIFYRGIYLEDIYGSILGMGIIIIPLILLYGYGSDFVGKDILGFGDIKLAMGIGSIYGEMILEKIFIFYSIAFLLAAVWGIVYIRFKKLSNEVKVPLAPFISIAGIICLF
jgi:leader peptidase (prepilin peptidase)/N-methyltransferase